MTTTLTWADTKHRAIQAFNGELPNADTEQAIIDAFTLEPQATLHALDAVIEDFRAGKARSGWAIWRSRIQAALRTPNIEVVYADSRQKRITLAEAWIRHTGGYIDREDELVDELFGDRGQLRDWPDLKPRMIALWEAQRPRFAQTEQEAIERQKRQAEALRDLRTRKRCTHCGKTTRAMNGVCRACTPDLAEDWRYSEPPDDNYLESIAPDEDES